MNALDLRDYSIFVIVAEWTATTTVGDAYDDAENREELKVRVQKTYRVVALNPEYAIPHVIHEIRYGHPEIGDITLSKPERQGFDGLILVGYAHSGPAVLAPGSSREPA